MYEINSDHSSVTQRNPLALKGNEVQKQLWEVCNEREDEAAPTGKQKTFEKIDLNIQKLNQALEAMDGSSLLQMWKECDEIKGELDEQKGHSIPPIKIIAKDSLENLDVQDSLFEVLEQNLGSKEVLEFIFYRQCSIQKQLNQLKENQEKF